MNARVPRITNAVGVPPRQSSSSLGSIAAIASPNASDGSAVIATSGFS